MSEIYKYEAYKKKLQGICDENNLVFRFRQDAYPVTLTIRPVGGVAEQMSMLESVEEKGYISPEAYIVFSIKDGALTYKTSETFTIGDALFTKIKNLYKNMHYLWLQHFFREIIEKSLLAAQHFPSIYVDEESSSSGGDMDDEQIDGMEPLDVDDESVLEDVGDIEDIDDDSDENVEDADDSDEEGGETGGDEA